MVTVLGDAPRSGLEEGVMGRDTSLLELVGVVTIGCRVLESSAFVVSAAATTTTAGATGAAGATAAVDDNDGDGDGLLLVSVWGA